jgi:hypothetical protein
MSRQTALHACAHACVLLAGMGLASTAVAQQSPACPQLPGDAGLTWEYRGSGGTDLCRALRADGSEAFGLVISAKPTFEPQRPDRAERSQIDGRDVTWYRAELAAKPGVQARETVIALPDGRSAHLWLQADDDDKLAAGFRTLQGLHFAPTGPQVAAGQ